MLPNIALKIILLQCFQFLIFNKISCIQTDSKYIFVSTVMIVESSKRQEYFSNKALSLHGFLFYFYIYIQSYTVLLTTLKTN